jgi:glycosyltransferase involved in cell wall biosynthesis
MRILITTFSSAPHTDGVARVVEAHAEGLRCRGHDVVIATEFDPARAEAQDVVQFAVHGSSRLGKGFRGEVSAYVDFIQHWQGDVIMCHAWQHWATDLAVRAFPRQRARKILVSHGFSAHCWPIPARFPRGLTTWLSWRPYVRAMLPTMRQFDRLVFLSDQKKAPVYHDYALACRAGLKNITCIPAGVHLAEFNAPSDFREAYKIAEKHILLCVATYAPSKNQLLALQVFARMHIESACLVFIGPVANDYVRELQCFASTTKLPGRVLFLERLERQVLLSAYQAASVFLCTSIWESGPLVILEAMAAQLPFISTNVGIAPQLPGGLVVSGVTEMAHAVSQLLSDPLRRTQLGAAGRFACEQTYNWEKIVDRYDELLRSPISH